jgi:FkbM family methyltransferase
MKIIDTRYGSMMVPANDLVIGRSLNDYGEWSQAEIDFLLPLAEGKTVLDVGANIGTHTLALAPVAKAVIAFEPQPLIFNYLAGNIAFNQLKNVIPERVVIGNKHEATPFHCYDLDEPNNYGTAHITDEGSTAIQIQLDAYRLPECGLIKMDIEGYELQALQGAMETIQRCQPVLYMEAHCDREPITELLKGLNYSFEIHKAPSYNPDNWRQNPDNWHGAYVEENIYAYPNA